jgi:hypothetical protein
VLFIPIKLLTEFSLPVKSVGRLLTLFIMSITKGITNGKFRQYFSESSGAVHFSIALLITVLYRQNIGRLKSRRFLKNFD